MKDTKKVKATLTKVHKEKLFIVNGYDEVQLFDGTKIVMNPEAE